MTLPHPDGAHPSASPRAVDTSLRGAAPLSAALNFALAGFVVGVLALGFVAWGAITSLRHQVERWGRIEVVDDARNQLLAAVAAQLRDPAALRRDAVAAGFDRLDAEIARLAMRGDDRRLATRAARSTTEARAAFERAVAQDRSAIDAIGGLQEVVARMAVLIGAEAAAARTAAAASDRASQALEQQQRDSSDRLRALMGAMIVAERIRQRVEAFARYDAAAAGGSVPISLNGLPAVCTSGASPTPDAVCDPSSARLRAAVAGLAEAPAGPAAAQAFTQVAWAAEAYVRAGEKVLETLNAALDVAVDSTAAERENTAARHLREAGIVRLNRALIDMRVLVGQLAETPLESLEGLHGRMRGALGQIRSRGLLLFTPDLVGEARAAEARDLALGIERAWAEALAAARAERQSAADMAAALDRMGGDVSRAAETVRNAAEAWIDLFARLTVAVLVALAAAAAAAASAAYYRVTRPLARVTDAILTLARGEVSAPVAAAGGGGGFARLFEAIETLRRANLARIALERDAARAQLSIERQRAEAGRLETALRDEQTKIRFHRSVISMVNHELRTPLAVIDGQARWLHRKLDAAEPEAMRERLSLIRRSVTRLTGLMETFLLNARIESGELEYRPQTHDLRAVIADVCAMQAEVTPSHRIMLEIDAAPDDYPGDERLLRQAMANLLSNAVKYSPAADRVAVKCERSEEGLVISVRDWGLGVPAEEIARLGGQFFRASTNGGIMGTGVGLYLVKTVTEAHGGVFSVVSEVGRGSTFTLRLPWVPTGAAAREAPRAAAG